MARYRNRPKTGNPVGRPALETQEGREEIARKFEKYVDDTEMPIIAEFAYKNDLNKTWFYDWPEFANVLKKSTQKKETYLEQMGLTHKVNTAMAIFSLKQLGWSDKQEVTHLGDSLKITVETVKPSGS